MAKVYLVNIVTDDISKAEAFGDIKNINYRYVFGDEIEHEQIPMPVLKQMQRCADEFDPDEDFLLIAGDHLQLIAFAAMLAARHNYFRVLRWDRKAEGYLPVQINSFALPVP